MRIEEGLISQDCPPQFLSVGDRNGRLNKIFVFIEEVKDAESLYSAKPAIAEGRSTAADYKPACIVFIVANAHGLTNSLHTTKARFKRSHFVKRWDWPQIIKLR